MRALRTLLLPPAVLLLLAAAASAQIVGGQWDLIYQFDGAAAGDHLGFSVAGAGDVDGDGFDDVIVGAAKAAPGGVFEAGSAYIFSGATGSLIRQFDGVGIGDKLGASVAGAGDVDGDGFDDVIVGAPGAPPGTRAGAAYVYSGATGALIWQFNGLASSDQLGDPAAGAGDVDGDGTPDLIVGAFAADPGGLSSAGSAYVYSGATGGLIWEFHGTAAGDWLGDAVAGAGDVDGDGFDDVVVGAPNAKLAGQSVGSALLFSGATGTLIRQFDGLAAFDRLGGSVSGPGDLDGDGAPDLFVGASGADPGGLSGAGSAYVFSGATGALIWQFDGRAALDSLGSSVAGAGDVDGDGTPDLIVGAWAADPGGLTGAGSAYVRSGSTGGLIWEFHGAAAFDSFGGGVAGAGDADGDGLHEVIISAVWADPNGRSEAGSAYVYSLDPFLHPDAGELSASSGVPVRLGIDFPVSEAGFGYALLASVAGTGPSSLGGIEVPLTRDPLLTRLLGGWSPGLLRDGRGTLDANGNALARILSSPALAPQIGRTFYLAAVSYDSATQTGRLSSIARYLTVVP